MFTTHSSWKKRDIIGQLVCVIVPLAWSWLKGGGQFVGFFAMLLSVGIFQLLSVLVHAVVPGLTWKSGARKVYLVLLGLLVLFGTYSLTDEDWSLIFLYSLLYIGPVLCAFYFIITLLESSKIRTYFNRRATLT